MTLPIPSLPALAGGVFAAQASMLDPQGPTAGLSFTGGVCVSVGVAGQPRLRAAHYPAIADAGTPASP